MSNFSAETTPAKIGGRMGSILFRPAPPSPEGAEKIPQELLDAAQAGNAKAQYYLGSYYWSVIGISEAIDSVTSSAEAGYTQAQAWLGFLYSSGCMVERDIVLGMKWLNLGVREAGLFPRFYRRMKRFGMTSAGRDKADALAAAWQPKTA